jgi:hypothetical protein
LVWPGFIAAGGFGTVVWPASAGLARKSEHDNVAAMATDNEMRSGVTGLC